MFDIEVYNYISAADFSRFVEFEWGIPASEAYYMLLNDDYIEGNLGSRHCIDDEITTDQSKWIHEFLVRWNLKSVRLQYP
jgi:hypothetical protein